VKNLELFDGAASAGIALDRLRGREVRTILPRVIMEGDTRRVLLPGDAGTTTENSACGAMSGPH